jgi:hypothetical protein
MERGVTASLPVQRRTVRALIEEAQNCGLRIVRIRADLAAGTLDIETADAKDDRNTLDAALFETG